MPDVFYVVLIVLLVVVGLFYFIRKFFCWNCFGKDLVKNRCAACEESNVVEVTCQKCGTVRYEK